MKMLRITDCSNSSFWYAGKIGSVVQFIGVDGGEFITREPSGYVNIIKVIDAELVNVTPADPEPFCSPAPLLERITLSIQFENREDADEAVPLLRAHINKSADDWLNMRTFKGRLAL